MALTLDLRGLTGGVPLDMQLTLGDAPVALIGPSGAGKTTILLAILGLLRPVQGRIALGEQVLFDAAAGVDLPPELRRLGYVPQHNGLFPHLDVRDNVAFGLGCGPRPLGKAERRARAVAVLEQLSLAHLADRKPRDVSGGEAQRIALARAVATEPLALLLDEPLMALDAVTRREVRGWLQKVLSELRIPALIVTHELADAKALAPSVAVLEAGRVTQHGTVAELGRQPASAFVEAWVDSQAPRG